MISVTAHTVECLATLASHAGAAIMEVYSGPIAAIAKADHSPVTDADVKAEAMILEGLMRHYPNIPVVAEEAMARDIKPAIGRQFFLVDPLDGTREFISRNGEFTVNIALIENAAPVLGIVYGPATGTLYWGATNLGAGKAIVTPGGDFMMKASIVMQTRPPATPKTILASRSHCDDETLRFIERHPGAQVINAGSSLKFCVIAEGKADLYPRFGRTMEWDTAAGHAVLAAAGGQVSKPDGSPFAYGKSDEGFANGPFIATG